MPASSVAPIWTIQPVLPSTCASSLERPGSPRCGSLPCAPLAGDAMRKPAPRRERRFDAGCSLAIGVGLAVATTASGPLTQPRARGSAGRFVRSAPARRRRRARSRGSAAACAGSMAAVRSMRAGSTGTRSIRSARKRRPASRRARGRFRKDGRAGRGVFVLVRAVVAFAPLFRRGPASGPRAHRMRRRTSRDRSGDERRDERRRIGCWRLVVGDHRRGMAAGRGLGDVVGDQSLHHAVARAARCVRP